MFLFVTTKAANKDSLSQCTNLFICHNFCSSGKTETTGRWWRLTTKGVCGPPNNHKEHMLFLRTLMGIRMWVNEPVALIPKSFPKFQSFWEKSNFLKEQNYPSMFSFCCGTPLRNTFIIVLAGICLGFKFTLTLFSDGSESYR